MFNKELKYKKVYKMCKIYLSVDLSDISNITLTKISKENSKQDCPTQSRRLGHSRINIYSFSDT